MVLCRGSGVLLEVVRLKYGIFVENGVEYAVLYPGWISMQGAIRNGYVADATGTDKRLIERLLNS